MRPISAQDLEKGRRQTRQVRRKRRLGAHSPGSQTLEESPPVVDRYVSYLTKHVYANVQAHASSANPADMHLLLRDVLDHYVPMLVDAEIGAFSQCAHDCKPVGQLDAVTPRTGGRENGTERPLNGPAALPFRVPEPSSDGSGA
jgi:hypothetical protein